MNEKTPEERFARCIHLIEKGYICFEDEAKELAKCPLQEEVISCAVSEGASRLYCDYLSLIKEGQCDYAPVARHLAERFKFQTRTLETALNIGMKISQRPTVKVMEE